MVIGRDQLQFRVSSSEAGYLYVFLGGTDKSHFYLLFPNGIDDDNRIAADTVVTLPRPGWRITAGGPAGVNHLVAIVSREPRDFSGLGLDTKELIPEFDLPTARRLWNNRTGAATPFVGKAVCTRAGDCDQRYGATLLRIEEVDRP